MNSDNAFNPGNATFAQQPGKQLKGNKDINIYIWSSDYYVYMARGVNEQDAREKLLPLYDEANNLSEFSAGKFKFIHTSIMQGIEAYKMFLAQPPTFVLLEDKEAMFFDHMNE